MLALPSDIRLKTRDRRQSKVASHDIQSLATFHKTSDTMGRHLSGTRFTGSALAVTPVPDITIRPCTQQTKVEFLKLRRQSSWVPTLDKETNDENDNNTAENMTETVSVSPLSFKRSNSVFKPKTQMLRRWSKEEKSKDYQKSETSRLSVTDVGSIGIPKVRKLSEGKAGRRTIYGGFSERRMSEINPRQIMTLGDLFKKGSGLGAISKWRFKIKNRPKISPLRRFRSYIRLALICHRLCKDSKENLKAARGQYLSIVQITTDYVKPLSNQGETGALFFDPTVFRANKEKRLPADARRILQKYFKFRTTKELNHVHMMLRSIQAFNEYPTKMQKALVKVGWYEAYEPKRAIVRQGQSPLAFYIILSGSVIVTSFDRKTETTTFLVALHRGMSFGELAVINNSRRQATVSTATVTEFLCISAQDFIDVFMSGGIQSITDPVQNSFIRSIPFLKHWPIESLAGHPQACMFHYFGRGQVLVRDSSHSDWIYIVKSGSLSVLKKLVEVKPRNTRRRRTDSDSEDEDSDSYYTDSDSEYGDVFGSPGSSPRSNAFGTWDFRIKKKNRRRSSQEKEVFKNNIEMEKRLDQTLPGIFNAADRLAIIDYDEIITDYRSRVLPPNKRSALVETPVEVPKITVDTEPTVSEGSEIVEKSEEMTKEEEQSLTKLPKIRKTSKGAYLATNKSSRRKATRKEAIQEELFEKQMEYDRKLQDDKKIGRKTITDDLDNKLIKDFMLTEKDIRPMFVLVQVLERGQHFGLTKSVFPEQAESFSIVSNGAECIMISKKFFLEKATEQTMLHLRHVETLLPPEEELQTNLQDVVDWQAHRAKVYDRLVRNRVDRTSRHGQYPSQYAGQYNFRTGPTIKMRQSSHF